MAQAMQAAHSHGQANSERVMLARTLASALAYEHDVAMQAGAASAVRGLSRQFVQRHTDEASRALAYLYDANVMYMTQAMQGHEIEARDVAQRRKNEIDGAGRRAR